MSRMMNEANQTVETVETVETVSNRGMIVRYYIF